MGGAVLTGAVWYIGRFSSLFKGLSVGDSIFLAAMIALATLLALAIIAAIIAWVFRQIWPIPASEIADELERTKERLKRAEERLDGAQVVAGVGAATGRADLSAKSKLTTAERERASAAYVKRSIS